LFQRAGQPFHRHLAPHVALLCQYVLFDHATQVVHQYAAQPSQELARGLAAKLDEIAVRFEERFLHHVRRTDSHSQVVFKLRQH
jgi:hypothetical protein